VDRRTTYTVAAALVAVLLVLSYAFGWFGGGAHHPAPAATTPGASGATQ
jgi:hypothetical protein